MPLQAVEGWRQLEVARGGWRRVDLPASAPGGCHVEVMCSQGAEPSAWYLGGKRWFCVEKTNNKTQPSDGNQVALEAEDESSVLSAFPALAQRLCAELGATKREKTQLLASVSGRSFPDVPSQYQTPVFLLVFQESQFPRKQK